MKVNSNFTKLPPNYLFVDIAKRVNGFMKNNPDRLIIHLGIGDVTLPLPQAVVDAMKKAFDEMGKMETFRGYGPECGYKFLRQAIVDNDSRKRGVDIDIDEIFVSDGAKCDTDDIGDTFGQGNVVAVCDPVYPIYVDTNVMAGRTGEYVEDKSWSHIVYMPCVKKKNSLPDLPREPVDLIYLCFPSNPSGVGISKEELKKWMDYANENKSLVLFDAMYEVFITTPDVSHGIYEIKDAKACAVEFRSFSKTAGFIGTHCVSTVVPKQLELDGVSLNHLRSRRQSIKMNGVPYVIQRAAEAVYSEEGAKQIRENITYYQNDAKIIREGLAVAGFEVYGEVDSPYIWLKTPGRLTAWEFFDLLLQKTDVVGTPGSGFDLAGKRYFRLTSFNTKKNTEKAAARIIESFKA